MLCARGASVNAKDNIGNTALMHASIEGQLGIVRLLLQHGADKSAMANNKNAFSLAAGPLKVALQALLKP